MKKNIIFVLLVIILCSCSQVEQNDQPNQSNQINQFDKNAWLNEPENRDSMLSSLTGNYELEGMTEEEITDLLGEPDQIISESSKKYLYFISYGRYFGINASLLQLQFNGNGNVESYSIVHK